MAGRPNVAWTGVSASRCIPYEVPSTYGIVHGTLASKVEKLVDPVHVPCQKPNSRGLSCTWGNENRIGKTNGVTASFRVAVWIYVYNVLPASSLFRGLEADGPRNTTRLPIYGGQVIRARHDPKFMIAVNLGTHRLRSALSISPRPSHTAKRSKYVSDHDDSANGLLLSSQRSRPRNSVEGAVFSLLTVRRTKHHFRFHLLLIRTGTSPSDSGIVCVM